MFKPRRSDIRAIDRVVGFRFSLRSLFLWVTLCALICALTKVYGLGILFAIAALLVLLVIGALPACVEHLQARSFQGRTEHAWSVVITFILMLVLSFAFLTLVGLAASRLVFPHS